MLDGKQRSYLRKKGNQLEPIVHIGKDGISQAVLRQTDNALEDHELVKIRVLDNSGKGIKAAANKMAENLSAEIVQVIGNVFLIFRRCQQEPIYNLPEQ